MSNANKSVHKIREYVYQIQNWLSEYTDPHHKVIITDTTFELVQGITGEPRKEDD